MEAVDELRGPDRGARAAAAGAAQGDSGAPQAIADLQREIARAERAKPEDDEEAGAQFAALHEQRRRLERQAAELSAELESIGPALIETRSTLGMKMSDFALDDHEGHEDALTTCSRCSTSCGARTGAPRGRQSGSRTTRSSASPR